MNSNKIQGRIKEKGETQATIAVMIGMSANSLSRKLTGKRQFTLCEVEAICNVLDIQDPTPYFFTPSSQTRNDSERGTA